MGAPAPVLHATHSYDSLLRLEKVEATPAVATREYDYRDLETGGKTTTQVEKLTYSGLDNGYAFQYGYDSMGNISSYTVNCPGNSGYSKPAFAYTYDNQNQLLSAVSGNRTYSYTYDSVGNILTANKNGTNHTYTYGNADWKDLLTAYDGQTITYDNAGNPTSYYNGTRWTFTWGNGRRLETATNGSTNISYNYTADGIRTSKTINDVPHTYYSGSTLLRETYDENVLDFFYDANGTPVAFKYNDNVYYYITNLQGDVIRLVDSHGNTAACYEYDPYGNAMDASGSHAAINPLRYRGYYYDNETGLYYCQSRYYDPVVGRFINSDSYASTGQGILGYNAYAYCNNNPVVRADPTGSRYVMRSDPGGAPKKEAAPVIYETPSPEDVALDEMREKGFTLYKGTPLIRAGNGTSAFTFGCIFMGSDGNANLLKHEYGHIVQSQELGIKGYTIFVVIPSVIVFAAENADGMFEGTYYYSQPWEYKADEYGGASHEYQPWAKPVSDVYWAYASYMSWQIWF